MKNQILGIAFVALLCFCAYNTYNSQKVESLTDLSITNIEALAQNEGGGVTITCSRSCTDGIGQCYIRSNSGYCAFTGYQVDFCVC